MNNEQGHELSTNEKYIVLIASYAATGNLTQLKDTLNAGLDTGLTINQIREELIQLYAYCGFPRSLNGITTFMSVLEERKSKGLRDVEGESPTQVIGTNDSKYEAGRKTLEALTGRVQSGPLTGANAFAPGIDAFLKEHLFADIFGRGVLTYAERELVTIAALSTLTGLVAQLHAHLGMGLNAGLTEAKLEQLFTCLETSIGRQQAGIARSVFEKLKEQCN